MLTILISVVVCIIIGIILESFWEGLIWGMILGFIIAFSLPAKMETVTMVVYLESLQDNSSVEGNFFLGSGAVNGVWCYSYYVKSGNAYYLESIPANGTPVIPTSGRPRIEWKTTRMIGTTWENSPTRNIWAIDMGEDGRKTVYVPKGTIKKNYTLDAR